MIVSDVRPAFIHDGDNSIRYRYSKKQQRKRHHIHAGELTLDLDKVDVDDTKSCTVFSTSTSKSGCIGSFYETVQQREERLDAARRQQRNRRQRLVEERSPSRSSSRSPKPKKNGLGTSPEEPERVNRESTRAAIKIQRAYRAHRAIQILNKLEQRILDAFNPTRDSRSALSYLRARSAEFAALRAFMNATPHVSDNERVADAICRVSETLKRSVECAEWGERDRKIEATVVHRSDSLSKRRKREEVDHPHHHHANAASMWRVLESNSAAGGAAARTPPGVQLPFSLKDSSIIPSPQRRLALETKCPESRIHHSHSSQFPQQRSDRRENWISRVLSASPPHRLRRHLTASKVPALLTIPEGSELAFH